MTSEVAVAHITDIHLKDAESANKVRDRLLLLPAAIKALSPHAKQCFILIGGDIAYAGKAEQYVLFEKVLDELKAAFCSLGISTSLVSTPGNHDCDFGHELSDARSSLLAHRESSPAAQRLGKAIQREYAAFATRACVESSNGHELLSISRFEDAPGLVIWSLNSAWASGLPDIPGLWLPDDIFKLAAQPGNTTVVMMHHPIAWFEPESQRRLQRWLAANANLVLMGHEHLGDSYTVQGFGTDLPVNFRHGEALCPHESSDVPGFSLYLLDLERSVASETVYSWEAGTLRNRPTQAISIKHQSSGAFWFTPDFEEGFLNDAGLPLKHPKRVHLLKLSDVYVKPKVKRRDWRSQASDSSESQGSSSNGFPRATLDHEVSIVFGAESSGLTTLAKDACRDLADWGHAVVYLAADKMPFWQKSQAQASLEKLLKEQANLTSVEFFASAKKRVAVVDNFDMVPANSRASTLKELRARFNVVVLFARDYLEYEALMEDRAVSEVLSHAAVWDLYPVGHEFRSALIRKWLLIGGDESTPAEEFRANFTFARRIVDQMIGRFMMPKTPLSVLLLLQQLEALRDNKNVITDGSQGFFIESFATDAVKANVKATSIDAVFTFLSFLAKEMRQIGRTKLEKQELRRAHLSYQQVSLHEVALEKVLVELKRAGLLRVTLDENEEACAVRFRSDYWYQFFLATYLSSFQTDWSRKVFEELVESIHADESSSTLSFLAYLNRSTLVVDALLKEAGKLFVGVTPIDMSQTPAALVELQKSLPKPRVSSSEDEMQAEADKKRDDEESTEKAPEAPSDVNRAFKVVHVLGQIMRSNPGTMDGALKLKVLETCFSVVRRFLSGFVRDMQDSLEETLRTMQRTFQDRDGFTEERAHRAAKSLLAMLFIGGVLTGITRVSTAVGSRDLRLLYSEFQRSMGDKTTKLMLLAVKLEHYIEMPESELDDFLREMKPQHVLMHRAIQAVMHQRFYMFKHSLSVRRKYCAKLGLDHTPGPAAQLGRDRNREAS